LQLSSDQWYEENKSEIVYPPGKSASDGYPATWLQNTGVGEETCSFYPLNKKDNLPGIPKAIMIKVKNKTTATLTPSPSPAQNSEICQPKEPSCPSTVCESVYCNDGCGLKRGTKRGC
jgi:hypothetical protein